MPRVRALTCATALLVLVVSAAAPSAAAAALAEQVPAGDPAAGQALTPRRALLAFIDLDGDQQADMAGPAEPLYLDADASGRVSFGDVRLTAFGDFPAGSDVQAADGDNERALQAAAGWLAQDGAGAWYGDIDGSSSVTPGDLRLSTGERVAAGDGQAGTALARSSLVAVNQVEVRDADGDGRRDAGEAMYIDLDRSLAVSAGDLRLLAGAVDDAQAGDDGDDSGAAEPEAPGGGAGGDLRGFDIVLLALVVACLAGVAYAIREARSGKPPRNPFK